MNWLITDNTGRSVETGNIPVIPYGTFYDEVCSKLQDPQVHIGHYFAVWRGNYFKMYCILMDDKDGRVLLTSYICGCSESLTSLTDLHPQAHPFERGMSEATGIKFANNPWDKPLKHSHDSVLPHNINDYPFYSIEGESLHEVNVGPVHAGIIEPGAFRFICNGEKVLHLEIALGYQHRGIEKLIPATNVRLKQAILCENIAGDSALSHGTAYAMNIEALSRQYTSNGRLDVERAVAVEMERIAMHIADTSALCADIGYQTGQVACENLRTVVINTLLHWCGNRFGKGLIRPCGTNYKMTGEICEIIDKNITDVERRYRLVREDLNGTQSLLARFEDCGIVPRDLMEQIGGVGMAARASGSVRDIRYSHPYGPYRDLLRHEPVLGTQGDIMARLTQRCLEVEQSARYIKLLTANLRKTGLGTGIPDYGTLLNRSSLSFSFVEGWRGEICHVAITGQQGEIVSYHIKDPSIHNWLALALAVRGEGISDFPVCNKSFNLSYCGHDL